MMSALSAIALAALQPGSALAASRLALQAQSANTMKPVPKCCGTKPSATPPPERVAPPASSCSSTTLCRDAHRAIAAASESPAFASLDKSGAKPLFLNGGCFVSSAGTFECFQDFLPDGETAEALSRKLGSCLPGSSLVQIGAARGKDWLLTTSGVAIKITETGLPRAHTGRSIRISVRPKGDAAH